jgi:hypothetical protein
MDEQAPTETDRALVVGIERYPRLNLNPLKGPVRDANRMADWLVRSAKAHVTLITSDGSPENPWTVSDLRPTMQDVTERFVDYLDESNGRPTRRLGRRLYVYMAGHGFMPEPRNLAIIAADARSDVSIPNVQATSWVDWFAEQLYFDEYVLFMDCCATRTFLYDGGRPLLKKTAARQDGRGKVVMGFAAGPSVETFEGPLADGQIGGFFTDKLLKGLKGAAAHGDGVVRTSGLISYFKNSLGVVGDGAVADSGSEHAVDPMFPERDELVFARVELPKYVFRAPLADGVVLQIFDTADNRPIASGPMARGAVTLPVGLGIYRARAPNFLKLFEIASGTAGEVNLA